MIKNSFLSKRKLYQRDIWYTLCIRTNRQEVQSL